MTIVRSCNSLTDNGVFFPFPHVFRPVAQVTSHWITQEETLRNFVVGLLSILMDHMVLTSLGNWITFFSIPTLKSKLFFFLLCPLFVFWCRLTSEHAPFSDFTRVPTYIFLRVQFVYDTCLHKNVLLFSAFNSVGLFFLEYLLVVNVSSCSLSIYFACRHSYCHRGSQAEHV